ncbi:PREDICTED: aminoacylase-1-like isoform X1 [Ipomoea nil]|uniref:aminoacylase-1-like isoform X1 n=1 Tax=Ipomoea nil TaxID=35883 RepID=UPI00090126E7|nr:PREDICTED: aminoacylase-1-like isoform X1 [Ipomoea nil]XP_019175506.1 PREDICTED: aminoacylase-1-like isoform X1 [Ipomoea nil]XP_019175507.1 PREDICTED: aminoacylase-1-like isoform X1 [Ipomoea nil]
MLICLSAVTLFLSLVAAGEQPTAGAQLNCSPVTHFQQYLRINTAHPNPDYASAVSFLTDFANSIPGIRSKLLYFTSPPNKPLLLLTWLGSNPSLPSVLFNSHLDSVPAEPTKWSHPPFSAHRSSDGKIFARGAQDDKCIGIQYLEAIKAIQSSSPGFTPLRNVHISFVPDEEIGGFDGMAKFVESQEFKDLNVGFVLDEGQASPTDEFRVFYADRVPWHMTIKAVGMPGHGSRLYDNSGMENLMKSVEIISKFRDAQFDKVKAGLAANSEVISVNPVYLKAGTPSPTGFVMNMQPSEAEAGFDIRMPPTADPELMRKTIAEEWAPAWRNMTYEIIEKGNSRDFMGRPLVTPTSDSNPWWCVFKEAITKVGGKIAKPEILSSTTDARFMRERGIPTLGFSPMKNTPILLHDHNEFLKDTVFLEGIKVYESIIKALSSFEEYSSCNQILIQSTCQG